MNPMNSTLKTLIGLGAAASAVAAFFCVWTMLRPLPITNNVTVHIARRSSISGAVDSIHSACRLPTPLLVKWTVRLMARILQRPVLHGWYVFTSADTQWDVVRALVSGRLKGSVRVTLPEGLTYHEMAGILSRVAQIDSTDFVAWCENDSVIQIYAPEAPSMEGYLMPDTYDVNWRDDASAVGDRLGLASQKFWRACNSNVPRHNVLTLASIVQAEAAVVDEMPRIAGVYANRLRRGMRLEADPTVQYGRVARTRVLYRHLEDAHAYNTYLYSGLPPGPICNAGATAIRAALAPEEHNFIFFVAVGDSTGLHRFARTGAEHLSNVARYRMARR